MADLPQEQLRLLLLDRRGRLIDTPLVYQGGQTEMDVRLADCFREAVHRNAAAISKGAANFAMARFDLRRATPVQQRRHHGPNAAAHLSASDRPGWPR
ncbi:MAG: hypothetical protein JO352_13015 [Chloroflexi bacterium]|nr:hypothetical protein [Chloroflexota bacterium]MBV9599354.1 hypothetical protein [Chloroflexota bacterium]